jgi:hypothetical protein
MNILNKLFGRKQSNARNTTSGLDNNDTPMSEHAQIEQLVGKLKADILTGRDVSLGHESVDAAAKLAKIGEPAVSALRDALSRSSDAYLALGMMGGETAFQILIVETQKGLESQNPVMIKAATRGLGYLGDIRALDLLNAAKTSTQDALAQQEVTEAIKQIQVKNASPKDPTSMLINAEQLWRTGKRREALSLCEQLETLIEKLDKSQRGWYWFLRANIVEEMDGKDDPRMREYCLRSLAEGLERMGAWLKLREANEPLSEDTFRQAVANTPGLDDLKAKIGINSQAS